MSTSHNAKAKAKRQRWQENESITRYWLEYYTSDTVILCSLCGNTGVIDTTATAISPAGISAGRRNWCICPNGQSQRHLSGNATPPDVK